MIININVPNDIPNFILAIFSTKLSQESQLFADALAIEAATAYDAITNTSITIYKKAKHKYYTSFK
jgi:hypothetical protein